jgi:hypothetical protein
MCRFGLTPVLLEIALCHPVVAQNLPSAEVFGGHCYLNVDVQSGTTPSPGCTPIPRQSANGWEVAASFNVHRWFAIEGDFGGYHKSVPLGSGLPNLDFHAYSYTGGPRFNYRQGAMTLFAHSLIGGDSLTSSVAGLGSLSQSSFAAAFGGGVEWKIGRSRDGRSADLGTRWPGDKVPGNRCYECHLI